MLPHTTFFQVNNGKHYMYSVRSQEHVCPFDIDLLLTVWRNDCHVLVAQFILHKILSVCLFE